MLTIVKENACYIVKIYKTNQKTFSNRGRAPSAPVLNPPLTSDHSDVTLYYYALKRDTSLIEIQSFETIQWTVYTYERLELSLNTRNLFNL